ncbi:MAG: diadenylate cyclase [Pirellulaceae bacterium]|nr:diadenylate cyclase [Planctomycetales bacterium]
MAASKFHTSLMGFVPAAAAIARWSEADALLLLLDDEVVFDELLALESLPRILVATSDEKLLAEAQARQIAAVQLKMTLDDAAVNERLTQALLESVADEFLKPGANVVAVYSAFDDDKVDSISSIRLTEHLGRLTARDLQRLETQVPLETLKSVVDLAVEIGREGREGKPVGALFVVGDHRKVIQQSHNACFDFVKGYPRKDRNLFDSKVREGLKELAQLDGAFVVANDGVVEGSCRIIDTAPVEITLTTGLGARHWAAAAITRNTSAVSVVVSESSGTVRIFLNGEVVLRIEPMRRAMKWREFDSEVVAPKSSNANTAS